MINKLLIIRWAETWGIEFNPKKPEVFYVGHKDKKYDYFINVKKIEVKKELGAGACWGPQGPRSQKVLEARDSGRVSDIIATYLLRHFLIILYLCL